MSETSILNLIGREKELFSRDMELHESALLKIVSSSRFLVIGGAGSIGQAVTKEIFKRNPKKLHVVDISSARISIGALSKESLGMTIDELFASLLEHLQMRQIL